MMKAESMGVSELAGRIGFTWAPTNRFIISQKEVDLFGSLIHDEQWIHTDIERAKYGPFGGTIVHGFLALSMCTRILDATLQLEGYSQAINYGLNRVRFPTPLPVGAQFEGQVTLATCTQVTGGLQAAFVIEIRAVEAQKPSLVAEFLVRYFTE